MQFQLRVLEARLDPDARAWVQDMKAASRDGRLDKELDEQPSIEELLDEWNRSRPS
jgi:hypothetical protein